MKARRFLAAALAVVMLFSVCGASAFAAQNGGVSQQEGRGALRAQFAYGEGPEVNGMKIDYRYFSPVADETDDVKYPLVIWFHGMGQGSEEGKQISGNPIAQWSSVEYQSRFKETGGAFILCPRSPEEKLMFWEYSMVEPTRAAIDDFIAQHREHIDVTRIYIGGFSMGGKMTLKMATAYPEMFAAVFPICPAWIPLPEDEIFENLADLPIWLTSGVNDPIVNYYLIVSHIWEQIKLNTKNPENIRFSTLSKTLEPDGSSASSGHIAWLSVTNDMFSDTDGDYPAMSTVDGNGNAVTLTFPDGMISWISGFTSDYDGEPLSGAGNLEVSGWRTHNLFSIYTIIQMLTDLMHFAMGVLDAIQGFTTL